ncbi:unnamed protein product, partial [Symbiodinium sp. CCMP2456]
MNMVNQVPGIFLWGENHGALGGIAGMQERFLEAAQAQGSSDARHVELLQNSQDVVWEWLTPPTFQNDWKRVEVRGFKEIRWNETMVQFIRRSLPCSRLIFNFRLDLEAQSHSDFFKRKQRKPGAQALSTITDKAAALVAHSGLPAFQLPLENFSAPEFTRLARWLGAECSFDKVYNTNTGGSMDASTTDARCWCAACNATSLCSRRFLFAVLEAPNSTRPAELAEMLESLYFSESEELLPGAASLCETVAAMQRLLTTPEQTVGSNLSASDLGKGTAWTHPGPGQLPSILAKMQKMLWDWLEPSEQQKSASIRGFAARPLDLPCLLAVCPCARVVVSKDPGGRWK